MSAVTDLALHAIRVLFGEDALVRILLHFMSIIMHVHILFPGRLFVPV